MIEVEIVQKSSANSCWKLYIKVSASPASDCYVLVSSVRWCFFREWNYYPPKPVVEAGRKVCTARVTPIFKINCVFLLREKRVMVVLH